MHTIPNKTEYTILSDSLSRNHNHLFPDILTGKQPYQSRGAIFKPLNDVLRVYDLSLFDVRQDRLEELWVEMVVAGHQEAFHPDLFQDEIHQVVYALGLVEVVLRGHPACGDSAVALHVEQHCVQHLSPDIFEVDIDPVGEISKDETPKS